MLPPDIRRDTLIDCFADVGADAALAQLDTETLDRITENIWNCVQAEGEYAAPVDRGPDPRDQEIARLKKIIEDLQPQADAARRYREHVADLRCTIPEHIEIGADGVKEVRR